MTLHSPAQRARTASQTLQRELVTLERHSGAKVAYETTLRHVLVVLDSHASAADLRALAAEVASVLNQWASPAPIEDGAQDE